MNPMYIDVDSSTALHIRLKWTCQHELPCLITQKEPAGHLTLFNLEILIFLYINFLLWVFISKQLTKEY